MKYILTVFSFLFALNATTVYGQSSSPYKTSFKVDGPITAVAVGLNGYGLYRITDKDGMSEAQVLAMDKNDVNKFDRPYAGNYDLDAKNLSDFGFYGSFALPLTLLFNEDVRSNAGQTAVLYVETMAITGALFTMANGFTERRRPLAYGEFDANGQAIEGAPMDERIRKNAKNSFFAGHTAATAGASFFFAKVFHDYNPDSPWKPVVWGAAAALPAGVGYLRLKAGKHFLSDNIIGYVVGAGAGILVPQLHKKGNTSGLSLVPVSTFEYNGAALTYKF